MFEDTGAAVDPGIGMSVEPSKEISGKADAALSKSISPDAVAKESPVCCAENSPPKISLSRVRKSAMVGEDAEWRWLLLARIQQMGAPSLLQMSHQCYSCLGSRERMTSGVRRTLRAPLVLLVKDRSKRTTKKIRSSRPSLIILRCQSKLLIDRQYLTCSHFRRSGVDVLSHVCGYATTFVDTSRIQPSTILGA